MSESTYEVNLRNPHTATINLAAFYNSVRLDAGKRIGLFDGGLVAYVETTADYANNPANRSATNELSLRPALLRPTIAVGATAAAITLHNLHLADYQSLTASILILSDKIYNGVSPATKTIMDDHAIDHPSFFHQPWAMMDFIFARHGTVTSDHIAEAKRTLRLPFDNVRHSLDSHRVAMQHQFGFLHRAHNPVNQGDMMDFYETSVAAHPHILSAIRLYKNATLFADRSFVTMAAYTEIHAPDQVANSVDLGYANYTAATHAPTAPDQPPRIKSASRPRPQRGHDFQGNQHYCYVHGYASHKGSVCRAMLADPIKYTQSHRQASSHATITGGSEANI